MGFFSIIETFFFISLGITIVLVALLVYHFKQRLSSVEKKYETLFDIVSDMAKQLGNIQIASQLSTQNNDQYANVYHTSPNSKYLGDLYSDYNRQMIGITGEQGLINHLNPEKVQLHQINEESFNHMDDSDSEDNDTVSTDSSIDSVSSDSTNESDTSDESDISEKSENGDFEIDDNNSNEIKIISLTVGENDTDIGELTITPDNFDDNHNTDDVYDNQEHGSQIDYETSEAKEDTEIIVKKVENAFIYTSDSVFQIEKTSAKELYKKMSLSNLKATVISKGLCSDPSKMKKNELLKLLEDE